MDGVAIAIGLLIGALLLPLFHYMETKDSPYWNTIRREREEEKERRKNRKLHRK